MNEETTLRTPIKVACECPNSMTSDVTRITDYDFVIASHFLENEDYAKAFTRRDPGGLSSTDRFVILDNGAFELGASIELKDYKNIIRQVEPDVIVLPDVVDDEDETLEASYKFIDALKTDAELQELTQASGFMGVLQGSDAYEYVECLKAYKDMSEDIAYIGIPYHQFYRPKLIRKHAIDKLCKEHNLQIHILGLPNPFELLDLINIPEVVSVDSSLPVVSALDAKLFRQGKWRSRPVDLEESVDGRTHMIKDNILFMKQLAAGILNDPYLVPTEQSSSV